MEHLVTEAGMKQGTTILDAEKVFGNPRDADRIMDERDGSEISWTWPRAFGKGLMSRIKLRSGLVLGLADFKVLDDITIRFEHMFMPMTFNFCASRNQNGYILCKEAQNELRLAGSGFGSVSYRPVWHGEMSYPDRVPIRSLTVCMDPLLLNSFMDGQYGSFPQGLNDIANGDYGRTFEQTFTTTPAVNFTIHQIFDCPYKGVLKRFFLEAKTLELITYAMAKLALDKKEHWRARPLPPSDVKRVMDLREILLQNLENPPSLPELARKCGTNRNKLNNDFRQVFGTSVFEYLRTSRLEYARQLLESKKMGVSEVAFEVGYEHARNFTRAFKNHFGTNPKDHLF